MASRWSACSRPRWLLALLSWRDGPDPQPRPPVVLVSQREKSVERFQGVLVRGGTQDWIAPGQRQEGGQAGEPGCPKGGGAREEGDCSSGRAIGTAPLRWVFSAFESRGWRRGSRCRGELAGTGCEEGRTPRLRASGGHPGNEV